MCSDATDGSNGGVFSPATFGLGNGFDLSGEQFDTRPEDIRCERRNISGTDSKILADSVTAAKRESVAWRSYPMQSRYLSIKQICGGLGLIL